MNEKRERTGVRKGTVPLFFKTFYDVIKKMETKKSAMVAGITDHVCAFRELMTIKLAHAP